MHAFSVMRRCALLLLTLAAPCVSASEATQDPIAAAPIAAAPIAEIGGRAVARSELDAATSVTLAAQAGSYERERRRLDTEYRRSRADALYSAAERLVDQRVLALEASATGRTADALLAEDRTRAVTDDDVRSFYESQRSQIGQPLEAVAAAIREFLTAESAGAARREYLDALRRKYRAAVLLEPEREPVAATGPSRGPRDAAVTIVEFGDLQCPYCARLRPALTEVARRYPRDVRIVFRHLPLTGIHPQARALAENAVCAEAQGKFWEFHDAVYERQRDIEEGFGRRVATDLGLDPGTFDSCMASERTRHSVQADADVAEALDLNGTPVLFVNGRYMSGTQSPDAIARIVEDELRRRRRKAGG